MLSKTWLLSLLSIGILSAQSATSQWFFEGDWRSADLTTRSITGVTVSRIGGDWFLEVTGACSPVDCKQPRIPLMRISDDRADAVNTVLSRDGADLIVDQVRPGSTVHARLVRRVPVRPATAKLADAVRAAYATEFGVIVERPGIYLPLSSCGGNEHLTTTAYLRTSPAASTLLVMYMSPDGRTLNGKSSRAVLTPAGTIHVLSVLVRYPQTIGANALALWEAAQKKINLDHEMFAKRHGYDSPIVIFANTNVVIDHAELSDPKNPRSIGEAAARHGVRATDNDIVMVVDMNPEAAAGGFSLTLPERFIYMGNFSDWHSPLDEPGWRAVAAAAYHHEMAHHWGWAATHDWTQRCGDADDRDYSPFIVPPVLFGWDDLQGDRVPEIRRSSR